MKTTGLKVYLSEADMYKQKFLDAIERADKYEALVRESVVVLERMKYLSEEGLMIDEADDYLLEKATEKAKKVLGDVEKP